MENGWAAESYSIETEDHYVLQMFRIPGPLGETPTVTKPVVLLQHGLEGDMMQWVMNDPDLSPGFILAENGYDVWLGNNRGTRFGAYNTKVDAKSFEFW